MTVSRWNWIRWKYVLPRLAIVAVLGLVVRFGLDPALKWALVASGESAVGAKVELSSLETSLWSGSVTVSDLAVANPSSPLRNLVEATDSQVQLDVNALLHGRVVVTEGSIRGLQFDTDRETSGALVIAPSEESTGPSVFDPVFESASEMGDAWLDELVDRLDTDITEQLQSPKLAKELEQRWPQKYDELQQQVRDVRTRGKELQQTIREVKKNPLRGLEKLNGLQQELVALQAEVKSLQAEIGKLPQQAESDRQAVLAAREQDEALLREKLKFGAIDNEGLTQTLLGQPVSEALASTLGWVSWAREQVPPGQKQAKKMRGRGTTVLFTDPQPDFHVKSLLLEGTAQFNGTPLQLWGSLTNASSAPHLLVEPTQIVLNSEGAVGASLRVDLDRRSEVARDTLVLSCPQTPMPERSLGKADRFAIEMAAGEANLHVEIELIGDELTGTIAFDQPSIQLTPRLAKEGALANALNNALGGVDRLHADVRLSGTLKSPTVAIESDLGSQVAAGLNASVKQFLSERTDQLLASSREQVDAQLAKLTELRQQTEQKLLSQLGEDQQLLTQLAALTGGAGGKAPGLPSGVPQLGKSLRLDGLLR